MTEGLRYDAGKMRYDLLPPAPLSEVVRVYTFGAKKYADENWRNGLRYKPTYAAMLRHLFAWFAGQTNDPESGCHHLAHVVFGCLAIMEFDFVHEDAKLLDSKLPANPLDDRYHGPALRV